MYGGIISGPFILNFLELGTRSVKTLDVLIPSGPNAEMFTNYLLEQEEYKTGPQAEVIRLETCLLMSSSPPGLNVASRRTCSVRGSKRGPYLASILTQSGDPV